jgi:hypothetical protein
VDAKKGDWVQIYQVIVEAGQRTAKLPEDTKNSAFDLRVKGFIQQDANLGDEVTVRTAAQRTLTGKLIAVNPGPGHSFGRPVPELINIGSEVRALLAGCAETTQN